MPAFSNQAFDVNAFSILAFSLGLPSVNETEEILASVNINDTIYKAASLKTENCRKGALIGDISRSVCITDNEVAEILAGVNFFDARLKSAKIKTENCRKGLLQGDISRKVCFDGD